MERDGVGLVEQPQPSPSGRVLASRGWRNTPPGVRRRLRPGRSEPGPRLVSSTNGSPFLRPWVSVRPFSAQYLAPHQVSRVGMMLSHSGSPALAVPAPIPAKRGGGEPDHHGLGAQAAGAGVGAVRCGHDNSFAGTSFGPVLASPGGKLDDSNDRNRPATNRWCCYPSPVVLTPHLVSRDDRVPPPTVRLSRTGGV
jgi:hypothetical protein